MKRSLWLGVVAALLAGCFTSNDATHTSKTLGQELIDLKRAFDDGAITGEQYEEARDELVESAERR